MMPAYSKLCHEITVVQAVAVDHSSDEAPANNSGHAQHSRSCSTLLESSGTRPEVSTSLCFHPLPGSHAHRAQLLPGAVVQVVTNLQHRGTRKVQAIKVSGVVEQLLGPPAPSPRNPLVLTVPVRLQGVQYPAHVAANYFPMDSSRVELRLDQPDDRSNRSKGHWCLIHPPAAVQHAAEGKEAAAVQAAAATPAADSADAGCSKLLANLGNGATGHVAGSSSSDEPRSSQQQQQEQHEQRDKMGPNSSIQQSLLQQKHGDTSLQLLSTKRRVGQQALLEEGVQALQQQLLQQQHKFSPGPEGTHSPEPQQQRQAAVQVPRLAASGSSTPSSAAVDEDDAACAGTSMQHHGAHRVMSHSRRSLAFKKSSAASSRPSPAAGDNQLQAKRWPGKRGTAAYGVRERARLTELQHLILEKSRRSSKRPNLQQTPAPVEKTCGSTAAEEHAVEPANNGSDANTARGSAAAKPTSSSDKGGGSGGSGSRQLKIAAQDGPVQGFGKEDVVGGAVMQPGHTPQWLPQARSSAHPLKHQPDAAAAAEATALMQAQQRKRNHEEQEMQQHKKAKLCSRNQDELQAAAICRDVFLNAAKGHQGATLHGFSAAPGLPQWGVIKPRTKLPGTPTRCSRVVRAVMGGMAGNAALKAAGLLASGSSDDTDAAVGVARRRVVRKEAVAAATPAGSGGVKTAGRSPAAAKPRANAGAALPPLQHSRPQPPQQMQPLQQQHMPQLQQQLDTRRLLEAMRPAFQQLQLHSLAIKGCLKQLGQELTAGPGAPVDQSAAAGTAAAGLTGHAGSADSRTAHRYHYQQQQEQQPQQQVINPTELQQALWVLELIQQQLDTFDQNLVGLLQPGQHLLYAADLKQLQAHLAQVSSASESLALSMRLCFKAVLAAAIQGSAATAQTGLASGEAADAARQQPDGIWGLGPAADSATLLAAVMQMVDGNSPEDPATAAKAAWVAKLRGSLNALAEQVVAARALLRGG